MAYPSVNQRWLCLVLLSFLALWSTTKAHADDGSPWDAVSSNRLWRVGAVTVERPASSEQAWRQLRQAHALHTQTLAFVGRSFEEAHAALSLLHAEGHLPWEKALIAANHRAGLIATPMASRWLGFMDDWAGLSDDQRIQQHLSLRLHALRTGMALAPPACLAATLDGATLLVDLAATEDSIPGRRLRSKIEAPPPLDDAHIRRVLAGPDRAPAIAALALVALTSPATPILDRFELQQALQEEHCALRVARVHAHTMLLPASAWEELAHEWRELQRYGPLSDRWLWRFAIHRYLLGDARSVEELASMFTESYSEDLEGKRYMRVLSDIADGHISMPEALWPATRSGSNPTYRWVAAEAARVRGDTEAAEHALTDLMDMDVHFVAGWLSLASARSQLSRGARVERAFEALGEIAPHLPVYTYWIDKLASRRLPPP